MSNLFLLSEKQISRSLYLPFAHRIPRVDDRHVISGNVYVIRHDLQWMDALKGYDPHKTESCFRLI